jgi:hypothetical protein
MNVIRDGIQSNHLHGKKPPILKEAARAGQRQAPFSQLGHERSLTNPLFPVEMEFAIEIVYVGFSFGRIHENLAIAKKFRDWTVYNELLHKRNFLYC